jgi:hypothetical protein
MNSSFAVMLQPGGTDPRAFLPFQGVEFLTEALMETY